MPGDTTPRLWNEIVELGWPGIAVAEEYGGQGLGAVELAVLLEELGYACASTPLLSTAVAAAAIQAGGSDEQRARWLPGLVDGRDHRRGGQRRADRRRPRRRPRACCWTATAPGPGLAGGRSSWRRSIRRAATPGWRRALGKAGEALADSAAARVRMAVAAEVVGVCQRALEMTLEYVKDRKQFGVPVGSFQAVAHRCAQMLLHTESARSTAYFAAWAADADPGRLAEGAALAGAAAATAGREVAARRSRPTAGSGSPGRPMCTGSTSAPRSTGRCSAARGAIGRRWRGWPPQRVAVAAAGLPGRSAWSRACSDEGCAGGLANCLDVAGRGELPTVRQPQGVTT